MNIFRWAVLAVVVSVTAALAFGVFFIGERADNLAAAIRSSTSAISEQTELAVTEPIRPHQLSPHAMVVDGIRAERRLIGPPPVRIVSNIPNATAMRFGNTPEELSLSEFEAYAAEAWWAVRTGPGQKTVYAEFTTPDGPFLTTAAVPEYREELGSVYPLPVEAGNAMDPYINGNKVVWKDGFDQTNGRWAAYDYHGGQHGNQNLFYPASHHSDGYIWVDDSRWRIDTPENPKSVLALLVYPNWLQPNPEGQGNKLVDFRNAVVKFDVRGTNLDLKGGTAQLFVTAPGGRWNVSSPGITIGPNWATVTINLATATWQQSWVGSDGSGNTIPLDLASVSSFGIKFVGFNGEPTGILAIDNVLIQRP